MAKINKITNISYWIFRSLLVIAGSFAIWQQNWMTFGIVLITILLTFIPKLVEKKFNFDYPDEGELIILAFIFMSMYLGEVHTFYETIWWWDLWLHGLSGLIIADVGYLLVHLLNRKKRLNLSPIFIAIFTLSFAVTIGVIWEIFEFAMDSIFGLNMQKSGLNDTMWDLIFVLLGALVISSIEYLYLKRKFFSLFFKRAEKRFFRRNKDFFQRK